mmetsp:Transcript_50958/g.119090  ORF Transcript_50958/g.119090 Transcript_50958/m.119090 type:complete len:801 (-) Transcript_50958:20-2422(-)
MAQPDRGKAADQLYTPSSARGAIRGDAREAAGVAPRAGRVAPGTSPFPRLQAAGGAAGTSPPPPQQPSACVEGNSWGKWATAAQPASVRLPALISGAKEHNELVPYDEGAAADLQQQIDFYAIEWRKEAALSEQRHGQLLSFATQIEDLKQTITELQDQLAAKVSAEKELQQKVADQEVRYRMKELEVDACKQQLEEVKQSQNEVAVWQASKEKLQPSQVQFQVLGAKTEARFYADAVADMIRQQRIEVSRIVAEQRERLLCNFEERISSWGHQGHIIDVIVAWHDVVVAERHIKKFTSKAVQERRFANAHSTAMDFWDESASIERLLLFLTSWSRVVPGGRGRHAIQRQHAKEDKDENRHAVGMTCWEKDWDLFRKRSTWSRWCHVIFQQRKDNLRKQEAAKARERHDRTMILWKMDDSCMRMFVVLRAWDAWMCLQARRGSFTGHFGVQDGGLEDDGEGFSRTFQIDYSENWRSVLDTKVQEILTEEGHQPAADGIGGLNFRTVVGERGMSALVVEEASSSTPPNLSVSIWDCNGNPVDSTEDTRLPEEAFPLTVEVCVPVDGHSIEISHHLEEHSHDPSASAGLPRMTSSLSMLSQASQSVGGIRRGVASSTVHSAARHRQQQNNLLISVAVRCWDQERMQFEAHILLKLWMASTLYRKKPLRSVADHRKTVVDRAVLRWGTNIDSLALQAAVSAWASLLSSRMGAAAKARFDDLITKAAALWSSEATHTHLEIIMHAWRECVVSQKLKKAASQQSDLESRLTGAERRAMAAEARADKAEAVPPPEAKKGSSCCAVQ